jgi:hypothetical protein
MVIWIQKYNDEADAIIRQAPGRVLVVYCSAVRRHSIAILLAWVCGQGSKDDAHLQIARVCREQVDRRQEGAEVSLGQLRLTNAPHATQRGARRRDGELMECRKKAGANCYAHLETRKAPPAKVTVRLFGAAAAISTGPPTVLTPNQQQSRLNRSCSFHPLFHSRFDPLPCCTPLCSQSWGRPFRC